MSTPPPLLSSRVSSFVATSLATAASFSTVSTILSAVSEGIHAAATAEAKAVAPGMEISLLDEMNPEDDYEDCANQNGTQMHLSTNCQACGERVAIEVPLWLTEGMNGNSNTRTEEEARSEWRSGIVSTAVAVAIAIKESPVSLATLFYP